MGRHKIINFNVICLSVISERVLLSLGMYRFFQPDLALKLKAMSNFYAYAKFKIICKNIHFINVHLLPQVINDFRFIIEKALGEQRIDSSDINK